MFFNLVFFFQLRPKKKKKRERKLVLFLEIGQVKKILSFARRHLCRICIRIYSFNFKNKTKQKNKKKQQQQQQKKPHKKQDTMMSFFELALCTFNLLDRVVNFSWLFI